VVFCGIRIINIYAPSGTAKRTEPEHFFNAELPVLFSKYTHPIVIGRDFNCILQRIDSTGPFTSSKRPCRDSARHPPDRHVEPRSTPSHIHALHYNWSHADRPHLPVNSRQGEENWDRNYPHHLYRSSFGSPPIIHTDHREATKTWSMEN
jgi:hypothetical protein